MAEHQSLGEHVVQLGLLTEAGEKGSQAIQCGHLGAGAPGEVLDDALLIACGRGAVRILRAQREGRGAQDAADFLRGFPLKTGERLR